MCLDSVQCSSDWIAAPREKLLGRVDQPAFYLMVCQTLCAVLLLSSPNCSVRRRCYFHWTRWEWGSEVKILNLGTQVLMGRAEFEFLPH